VRKIATSMGYLKLRELHCMFLTLRMDCSVRKIVEWILAWAFYFIRELHCLFLT
jgi:hypothetical protein